MKQKILIKSHDDIANINSLLIATLELDDTHVVNIKPYVKETTSERQRKYYWIIIREIAKFTGATEDDQHLDYKQMYLVNIFRRRPDGEYEADLQAANLLYEAGKMEAFKRISEMIVKNTSIMKAKVKEMAEFLSLIILHGESELGLSLPRPEDKKLLLYKEAQ